jgi:membrane protein DedA with SNARE-associated domain
MEQVDLLQHYLDLAQPYLLRYGYAALFFGVLVEGFGVPAPGQSLVMAGALASARGDMNVAAVLLLGWAAAVLGDNIGYAIGRFAGRKLVLRYGRYVGVRPGHLERVERFFSRWGGGIVIVARFFEVLRQLNGVVAGTGKMPWWKFLSFNAFGAALWVGLWGGAAYYLGKQIGIVLSQFKRAEPYVIVLGVVLLVLLAFFIVRSKNTGNGQ